MPEETPIPHPSAYGCKSCKTQLAKSDDIISKNFRGKHGKACLFRSATNCEVGEAVQRNMTTGRHVVQDATCAECNTIVGFKYKEADEEGEKYKIGCYLIEMELICPV
ncbi:yippee-like protein [Thozetella sp. PMI_491]|nr:yippee-like protein [Thozetella sp. PMI_491]